MSLVAQKRMKEAANAALSVKTFMFLSLHCWILQLKRPFSISEIQQTQQLSTVQQVWTRLLCLNIQSGPDVSLD